MKRTPLKRGKKLNPVNRKRRSSEFARTYGSKARVQWVASLPCWACNYHGPTPRQNAHTQTGGAGRKADYDTIISLCPPCHMKSHDKGWLAIGMTEESRKRAAAFTQQKWEERGYDDNDQDGTSISDDTESTEDADP